MVKFRSRFPLLFSAVLVLATGFACDDQPVHGANNNKIECPLGQRCDGGVGNGGVFSPSTGGTENTATGGTTVATGGENTPTDVAEVGVDAASDSATAVTVDDASIVESVDAATDVNIAEANTIDAVSIGDETSVEADSTVGITEAGINSEPCEGGRVSGTDAKALVKQGALLLDVRGPVEFATDALPDAINIPLDELASRLDELPTDRVIITYCASGNRSGQAAQLLRDQGFRVCDLGPRSAWDR